MSLADPTNTISHTDEQLINSDFDISIYFSNESYPIGFGPFTDVLIPYGITISDYVATGIWSTENSRWENSSGEEIVSHPYSSYLSLPPAQNMENYRWYVLPYNYSSYGPEQPATAIEFVGHLDETDGAIIDVPLTIKAIPGFRYGVDAEDNPTEDSPIQGTIATSQITPKLLIVSKQNDLPESETATGSNFPFKYIVNINIANNKTLDNIVITDILPSTLQYVSINYLTAGIPFGGYNSNTNTISLDYGSKIGSSAENDISFEYTVYVPHKDINDNSYVLSPTVGSSRTIVTDVDVYYDYDGDSLSSNDDDTMVARSIAIRKTNNGNGANLPGDIITYKLKIDVSDYFSFTDISIKNILADGQIFRDNTTINMTTGNSTYDTTFTPATTNIANVGTQLDMDISNLFSQMNYNNSVLYGGQTRDNEVISDNYNVGATKMTITYDAEIDTKYDIDSNLKQIDIGDRIKSGDEDGNTVDVYAKNYDFENSTSYNNIVSDDSKSNVFIGSITTEKSIYAVNGIIDTYDSINANDILTYRIKFVLSHQNVQELVITDYIPPPIMNATALTLTSIGTNSSTPPGLNVIQYGPDHTFSSFKEPIITSNANDNSIIFNYGTYQTDDNLSSQTIDIMYTLLCSNEPTADGLRLTNQVVMDVTNTTDNPIQQTASTSIILNEPHLRIKKMIVGSNNNNSILLKTRVIPEGINFGVANDGDGFQGTITSHKMYIDPDIRYIDGFDTVRFAIIVENKGHAQAFGTTITDDMSEFSYVGNSLRVRYGDGTNVNYSGDLFGSGIVLQDTVKPYDNPMITTNNIVVITYDATTPATISPKQDIFNNTNITAYTNTVGGPNFSAFLDTDSAKATTNHITTTKIIESTSETHTNQANQKKADVVVGEYVNIKIESTIPAGSLDEFEIRDTIHPYSLELVDGTLAISFTDNIIVDTPNPTPVIGTKGNRFYQFGNLSNTNTDNDVYEKVIITYQVLVKDDNYNTEGYIINTKARTKYKIKNTTTKRYSYSSNIKLTVKEPTITINKTMSPLQADSGDTVVYSINLTNTSSVDAKTMVLTDQIPDYINIISSSHGTFVGQLLTYTKDTFEKDDNMIITITGKLDSNITTGENISNTANITWLSENSDIDKARNYNANSIYTFTLPPIINLDVRNKTKSYNLVDNEKTGQIYDTIEYTIRFYLPEGTNQLSHVDLLIDNLDDYYTEFDPNATINVAPNSVLLDVNPLILTPSFDINNNKISFGINQTVINSRNADGGDMLDYYEFTYDLKIKNSATNIRSNIITAIAKLILSNVPSYNIVSSNVNIAIIEPYISISKNITHYPKNDQDYIEYDVTFANDNASYIGYAYNVEFNNIIDDNFVSNVQINNTTYMGTTTSFIDTSSWPTISGTVAEMQPSSSITLQMRATLISGADMNEAISNMSSIKCTSQQSNENGQRTGERDIAINNYYDDITSNIYLVPKINILPGLNQELMVIFEDKYNFDYDYEDLCLNGQLQSYSNNNGVITVIIDFHIIIRGADFNHVFGIYIPNLSQSDGTFNVITSLKGNQFIDANEEIKTYLNIDNNQLSSLPNNRLPLFVSTHTYLPKDTNGFRYTANAYSRTPENPNWVIPSTVRCKISFNVPYTDIKIKMLPYIDVFTNFNRQITTINDKSYTITYGETYTNTPKGIHDNLPKAVVIPKDINMGYGRTKFKLAYPNFASWFINNTTDLTDLNKMLSTGYQTWIDATNSDYLIKRLGSEYEGGFTPLNMPRAKLFALERINMVPADMQISGTLEESDTTTPLNNMNNIVSVIYNNVNNYALKSDGTVVNTNWTNITKIISNSNTIYGLKTDGTIVNINDDVINWTNIMDIAVNNNNFIGLDKNHNILTSPSVSLNWSNIIEISASDDFIMGRDMNGQVFIQDDLGTNYTPWTNYKIVKIHAATGYCYGITNTYTVVKFDKTTTTLINNWTGIIDIKTGSNFIVGLKQNGTLVIDGKSTDLSNKENIIGIAANDSTIGAIKLI